MGTPSSIREHLEVLLMQEMDQYLALACVTLACSAGYSLSALKDLEANPELSRFGDLYIRSNLNTVIWESNVSRNTRMRYIRSLFFGSLTVALFAAHLFHDNNYYGGGIASAVFLISICYNFYVLHKHRNKLSKHNRNTTKGE